MSSVSRFGVSLPSLKEFRLIGILLSALLWLIFHSSSRYEIVVQGLCDPTGSAQLSSNLPEVPSSKICILSLDLSPLAKEFGSCS